MSLRSGSSVGTQAYSAVATSTVLHMCNNTCKFRTNSVGYKMTELQMIFYTFLELHWKWKQFLYHQIYWASFWGSILKEKSTTLPQSVVEILFKSTHLRSIDFLSRNLRIFWPLGLWKLYIIDVSAPQYSLRYRTEERRNFFFFFYFLKRWVKSWNFFSLYKSISYDDKDLDVELWFTVLR